MNQHAIKQNIALVMERISAVKKQYEERKLIRTGTGIVATATTTFSAYTLATNNYIAAIAGAGATLIGGAAYCILRRNAQRRQEQLEQLEQRKSDLEQQLELLEPVYTSPTVK